MPLNFLSKNIYKLLDILNISLNSINPFHRLENNILPEGGKSNIILQVSIEHYPSALIIITTVFIMSFIAVITTKIDKS